MEDGERNAIGLKGQTAPRKKKERVESGRDRIPLRERERVNKRRVRNSESERERERTKVGQSREVPVPCGDREVSRKCTLARSFSGYSFGSSRDASGIA